MDADFLFQKPLLIPYIETYIDKICQNLDTIYPQKTSKCFRYALKGQNGLNKCIQKLVKTEPLVLQKTLKTIRLPITNYEMTININPQFNVIDYSRVLQKVCDNIFNSAYRILYGKTLENVILKNNLCENGYKLCKASSILRQKSDKPNLWCPENNDNLCQDYEDFFGVWEEVDYKRCEQYISEKDSHVRFIFDVGRENNYIFTLEIPYVKKEETPPTRVYSALLLKIEIPTFYNQNSRPMMWRELGNSIYQGKNKIELANFLYNTIDTDKKNLPILVRLLNMYHESLNIFTIQRLSGIPEIKVLIFENGERDKLMEWLRKWTYCELKEIKKYDNQQLKHLVVILQKKYYNILTDEKYKIIISMYIEQIKNKNIDQLEIDLDILFNKILYKYLINFVKYNIQIPIFKFLRENHPIVNRRGFLIPKMISFDQYKQWIDVEINFKQVYEYNMIYFGNNENKIIDNLKNTLENIDLTHIKESFNHKIVPALKEDCQEKNESICGQFLLVKHHNCVIIYLILLVNHVQKLYRMPIKIIKLKFSDTDIPSKTKIMNFNSQDLIISNQDVFLETLNETNSQTEMISSLLFMKTLNSPCIDYKIRQEIIPDIRSDDLDKIITYKNIQRFSREEILEKLQSL